MYNDLPSDSKAEWWQQSPGPSQAREASTAQQPKETQEISGLEAGPAAAPTSVWVVVGPRGWEEAVRRGFLEW